jgi:hypothetical protein
MKWACTGLFSFAGGLVSDYFRIATRTVTRPVNTSTRVCRYESRKRSQLPVCSFILLQLHETMFADLLQSLLRSSHQGHRRVYGMWHLKMQRSGARLIEEKGVPTSIASLRSGCLV